MEIRWSDVDSYDHVNNAVYFTYLEEVRDEWLEKTFAAIHGPVDWVLERVAIDFRRELTLEDEEVVAKCGLVKIGTKSITTREEIWSAKGFLSAESESVMVAHDPNKRESRDMTSAERTALESDLEAPTPG